MTIVISLVFTCYLQIATLLPSCHSFEILFVLRKDVNIQSSTKFPNEVVHLSSPNILLTKVRVWQIVTYFEKCETIGVCFGLESKPVKDVF